MSVTHKAVSAPQRFPTPVEGPNIPSRVTLSQFLSSVDTSDRPFKFKELAEVGAAVHSIRQLNSDPTLMAIYNGGQMPPGLRSAAALAARLLHLIEGIEKRKEKSSIGEIAKIYDSLTKDKDPRVDIASFPPIVSACARYAQAFRDLKNSLSPDKFMALPLAGPDDLARAVALSKLATCGISIDERLLAARVGELEGEAARAKIRFDASGGDKVLAGAQKVTNVFDAANVKSLLDYARRLGKEKGVEQAGKDLAALAEFAESPLLSRGLSTLIKNLAFLADYDIRPGADRTLDLPIEGISKVIRNCISSMNQNSTGKRKEGAALPGLNGFLSESAMACRLLENGIRVAALDYEALYQKADGFSAFRREIDVVGFDDTLTASHKIYCEVKHSWQAVLDTLRKEHGYSFLNHGHFCKRDKAIALLIIEDTSSHSDEGKRLLNAALSKCQEQTGISFVVLDGHGNPIDVVISAKRNIGNFNRVAV